jgi:predicted enzyme involved in methoxymalonyl-ACP biosynthesis
MKNEFLNESLIGVIISDSFSKENNTIRIDSIDASKTVLEKKLEETFNMRFHLCGTSPEEFFYFENMYFSKNYRAYTRPYDTPDERNMAHEILNTIVNFYGSATAINVTYLYKLEVWNDQFKTFYRNFS